MLVVQDALANFIEIMKEIPPKILEKHCYTIIQLLSQRLKDAVS
jgi:hypothetical protein